MSDTLAERWQTAIETDDVEGARHLLSETPNLINQRLIEHRRDGTWFVLNPLMVACDRNNLPMARLLVEAGADVRARNPDGGGIALSNSCAPDLLDYLIAQGADVDGLGYNNSTPMMLAAYAGNLEAVKNLLQRGADVNIVQQPLGETALHRAAFCTPAARGSDPDTDFSDRPYSEIVRVLVEAGAAVNARASRGVESHMGPIVLQGETPLHFAAAYGDLEMVSCLMAAGGDPTIPNGRGETPRNWAAEHAREDDIVATLSAPRG